ncbi:MAG: DNA repair protein RadA [Treponema sp.]|jgi:DNA repair protein RadA/Sms|nr:DNA repair protein RadA [Treponema sp.]
MKKQRSFVFKCGACGHEEPKWLGRCPECGEWNTLEETAVTGRGKAGPQGKAGNSAIPQSFPLSSVDPLEGSRISSGVSELDRVLGGGIMKKSAILLGGEPGIGKSTLLLQAAAAAHVKGRILYVSGEESAGQVRMRADRLGIAKDASSRIEIFCSGNLESILTILEASKPALVMIDSAQTLFSSETGLLPGTVNQMKYCVWELISYVKERDCALFFTAHVTKDGVISGPKSLEHMVDTVLYFENAVPASGNEDCRFLRATKNRFGSVDEIGIFTMGEKGLSLVEDPSLLFLVRRDGELPPGVATAAVLEGSRPLLVEIQALTVPAKGSISRVFSDRIDSARVSRVAASIEKHLGMRLSDQDIYINVAGGIRIAETGADLALACAIYSARTNMPLPAKTAMAGELSLAGEIKSLRRLNSRIKAAANLGFTSFLFPAPGNSSDLELPVQDTGAAAYTPVKNIKDAIKSIFS